MKFNFIFTPPFVCHPSAKIPPPFKSHAGKSSKKWRVKWRCLHLSCVFFVCGFFFFLPFPLTPSHALSVFPPGSTGEMIVSSAKYHVQETAKSIYETRMSVTVRNFKKEDVGSYRCIAKNSLGEVDSSIRLYEIPGPTRKAPKYGTETNDILKMRHPSPKVTYQPDEDDLYGSAEDFDDTELSQNGAGLPGSFIKPTRAAGQDSYTRHIVPMVGLVTRSPYLIPAIGGEDFGSSSAGLVYKDLPSICLPIFFVILVTSYLPS